MLCDCFAGNIAFVVLSQPNVYHAQRAQLFHQHVISQAEMLHVVSHLTAFTRYNCSCCRHWQFWSAKLTCWCRYYYNYNHFTAFWILSGTTRVSWYSGFRGEETVSGSGISWAICKSTPLPRQITMPALAAPHHSVFLQAGCPSCHPTNSIKALKARNVINQFCEIVSLLLNAAVLHRIFRYTVPLT